MLLQWLKHHPCSKYFQITRMHVNGSQGEGWTPPTSSFQRYREWEDGNGKSYLMVVNQDDRSQPMEFCFGLCSFLLYVHLQNSVSRCIEGLIYLTLFLPLSICPTDYVGFETFYFLKTVFILGANPSEMECLTVHDHTVDLPDLDDTSWAIEKFKE